ncbi:MAG: DNA cytosine methyltransferase [Chloroflexota bacterium]|nr:DNA cytosine methyltransferase [Chloroflexota bacterium]
MIVDLFSGAGGFSLGAVQAGFDVAVAADHDPDLTSSHRHNFPRIPLLLRDLSQIGLTALLSEVNLTADQITGVVGGPPCQGFSNMGRRDVLDPRNSLVARFFGMVDELRPPFFVFENVPGILTARFRQMLDDSIDPLVNHYTLLGPLVLNAADFGAATERCRVIIVGIQQPHSPLNATTISTPATPTTVAEAFCGLPAPLTEKRSRANFGWQTIELADDLNAYALSMRRPPPCVSGSMVRQAHAERRVSGFQPTRHSSAVAERFSKVAPGSRDSVSWFPRLHPDRPAPTLRAGTGRDRGSYQSMRPIHPVAPRVVTVREAARIQGFPDWFIFHRTKWHSFRMIGNSIVPAMARAIFEYCRTQI